MKHSESFLMDRHCEGGGVTILETLLHPGSRLKSPKELSNIGPDKCTDHMYRCHCDSHLIHDT